jgi:NDP-sugar pyrophosphorylase family protein
VKAMLLAAGVGERLRPFTEDRPKCMMLVAGRPVLEWNIAWLRRHGIDEVVINLHHHPDVVTNYFGDGSTLGVSIQYSYEPVILGTAGALVHGRHALAPGRFLVVFADNVIHCDLSRLRELHSRRGPVATIAVFWRSDVSSSGVAVLDENDRVDAFVEKPADGARLGHWVNAGLLLCEERVIDWIADRRATDLGREVFPGLLKSGEFIQAYRMGEAERLYWIDTPADLAATRAVLETAANS